MHEIQITPYQIIQDKRFNPNSFLILRKEDFEGISYRDDTTTVFFMSCCFGNLIIENKENIDFKEISISFFGCYIKNVDISDLISLNISLNFSSCIVSGNIKTAELKGVSFNNCLIYNSIFLINQNRIDISYTDNNLFPRIWVKIINFISQHYFDRIFGMDQGYRIYDSKKVVFKTDQSSNEKPGIYRDRVSKIEQFKIKYNLNKEQKKKLKLNLSIQFSSKTENAETNIQGSYLMNLSLTGYSTGNINIENTLINAWYIREFSTQKEINFYNIKPIDHLKKDSKIEIHKSNLDRTWFDNIDFSEYKTVSFFRTKFGKAVFTACNFPSGSTSFEKFKSLENVHYPGQKSDNYYKDQYEVFLQLKILLEATGNFYEAQKLQAISNDALMKIKQISKWDRMILLVNRESNYHGLSIKNPLIYFLLFSIFFYILYLLSLGRIFNDNEIDLSLVGYYFLFIDITHRSDFLVDKEEFNVWSLAIDFINKIFLGFFIYQFISAFRKYGKK